ncbi:MAG TPA: SMC family ATPase [Dehalococcoidia bacterium]|nr:SMC family ATPase [Dehalococcoidia bacterium]
MIPVKLALKNFMCYRDNVPQLYFDSFHVACLCGDNGNGKSALLDAITWALWGKARAKSDDDLIHMGEREMEVEFEFDVGQNRYRILRKRTKGSLKRPGQPLLDLQVETAQGFFPIPGNTIGETQQKIIEILRMDYQTFINSALLLQGRADEFSMKRPGERKEVLANILDLSMYDELERLARDYRKEKEIQQQSCVADLTRIEQELEQKGRYETELKETQAAISTISGDLEKQEAALTKLRQSREALKSKEEQYKDIEKQIEQLSRQITDQNNRIKYHSDKIEKYEKVLSGYDEESGKIRTQLDELTKREQELTKMREQAGELSNRIHHLNISNEQLMNEMKDLENKINMLNRGEAECPLCGTELGVEGRERIIANYKGQGKEKGDVYRANSSDMQRKEGELKNLKQAASKLEGSITSERSQCERQAGDLERACKEAESSLPQEREALSQAQKALGDLRVTLQESTEKNKLILAEIQDMPRLEGEFNQAEKAFRELKDQERSYRDRLVEIQTSLRRCTELESERQQHIKDMQLVAEEKGIYEELALAFSKKGIQAMIIDSALPEIEAEANRLLGRMTDNRMHLKIESQRDTKKGDTVETLDIKISDELGTRNYEMFSGGETFRVNFALRIALSKLLAKRAGAPLPTLIVDEGFGTQDSTGRGKLVEAINSIQDDFEKILVITHIEELKEAFETRIEVTKTEEGSTFSLN